MLKSTILVLCLLFAPTHAWALDSTIEKMEGRGTTQQETLIVTPDGDIHAAVILIPGGKGITTFKGRAPTAKVVKGANNALIRNRELYAKAGLLTAVFAPPPSHSKIMGDVRTTPEHAEDIAVLVKHLKAKTNGKPVWIVGTSMGSISAAHAAISIPDVDGIVLTASVSLPTKIGGTPVQDQDVGQITDPVLIVHHEKDGCYATPYEGAAKIQAAMSRATPVQLITMSGGEDRGNPCKASGYHGFSGLDRDVTAKIAAFIIAH
ncbi:alpha/beta hydrolase [Magnetovibrio sp. PR-2]|uniref:alpha/beta hydrolase family protein n=1 Tax=Magnetovibrio sp. PR-2 TaxID=3120356 RepID=UPI002FCDE42C